MSLGTHRLPAAECKVTSVPLPLVPRGRPVFGNLGPRSGAMAEFKEDFRKPAAPPIPGAKDTHGHCHPDGSSCPQRLGGSVACGSSQDGVMEEVRAL